MKFQHFIRSQKRRADTNMRDHDMQWDFWTLSPQSAHQVTWLMGDRGIPKSWRQMNSYSSHTYMWVNAKGQKFWVKYHFKTDQGIDFLTQADADRLAGVTLPVDIYSWTTMWPDSLSRYACSSCDDHWPCSGFTEHRDAQHTN